MGKNGKKNDESIAVIEDQTELVDGMVLGDADVEGGDEVIVGFDSIPQTQKLGVMQRLVTAVLNDRQYRQVLLTGAFDNKHEANLAADSISERLRYGVTIQPIVDRVITQCAVKGGTRNLIAEILTRYQITHNYGGDTPDWKKRQNKGAMSSKM